jgi:hypothetical protein
VGINYILGALNNIQHHLDHIFLLGNHYFDLHDPLPDPYHEGKDGVCEDLSGLTHRQSAYYKDYNQQNQGAACTK